MEKSINYIKKHYLDFCSCFFAVWIVASVLYAYLCAELPHIERNAPVLGTIYGIMLALNSLLVIGIIVVKNKHCRKLTACLSGVVILLSWSMVWWGWIRQDSDWFLISAFLTALSGFCFFILCLRWNAVFATILPYFPLICLLFLNKETYNQASERQRSEQNLIENSEIILRGIRDNYIYTQEFGIEKICPQDTCNLKPGIKIRRTLSSNGDVRISPI